MVGRQCDGYIRNVECYCRKREKERENNLYCVCFYCIICWRLVGLRELIEWYIFINIFLYDVSGFVRLWGQLVIKYGVLSSC